MCPKASARRLAGLRSSGVPSEAGRGSVSGESAVSSSSPVIASKSPFNISRPFKVFEAKSSLRSVSSAGGFLPPKVSCNLVMAARMRSVRASGPVAAVIMAVRARSRPSWGRFFGGVSAKVRINAAWSMVITPVLTASAMSGKFFMPRARATILVALDGERRVVEVSQPAGPGNPSFSRLTRVSMSATRAIRRASNSWILWETSAASARSSASLSCQISVVMDQVYRTCVRCAMMMQSKTIAVQKDSGIGRCRWSVISLGEYISNL